MRYNGETYRPLHDRFTEHFNNANNPNAPSYINTPLAKHYREHHPNITTPELRIKILKKCSNTADRKVSEARIIAKNSPEINDRHELNELKQFLV